MRRREMWAGSLALALLFTGLAGAGGCDYLEETD